MTFHLLAWHTPANEDTEVTRRLLPGSIHVTTISTHILAVLPLGLCGMVSCRDLCSRGLSGQSREAYGLGAGHAFHTLEGLLVFLACLCAEREAGPAEAGETNGRG